MCALFCVCILGGVACSCGFAWRGRRHRVGIGLLVLWLRAGGVFVTREWLLGTVGILPQGVPHAGCEARDFASRVLRSATTLLQHASLLRGFGC